MTILVGDLRFFQTERMTDNDDGGGRMTATEIVSGVENSIFDDLSDVDLAAGDCSIRKVVAAVASDGPDKYLDAGVVLFTPPKNPAVSVLLFSTGSHYDERADLQKKIELSISRGGLFQGLLYGPHTAGQRSITLWQRTSSPLPEVGDRLDLSARSGGIELRSQVVWITRVISSLTTFTDDKGTFQVLIVTAELAEGLRDDYDGTDPTRVDVGTASVNTVIYKTRYNPDAVSLNGIAPLVSDAAIGDREIKVDDLYNLLIPTAFVETAIPDATPGGDIGALVSAGSVPFTVVTTADAIKPGASLFLGSLALPGSVSIDVGGSIITDSNGALKLSGLSIGAIDYNTGVCTWADSCPSYGTASKSITFMPAALPVRVANTASQAVTVANRGYVWVITLAPVPTPGSLRVAYRVANNWYVIQDGGSGLLTGADSSYGSGTINYTTGTVTVTTGEIPDVESEILYSWATPANYFSRGGSAVEQPTVNGVLSNTPVIPESVTIEWGGYHLVDDGSGGLVKPEGDTIAAGSGSINYRTGEWTIIPAALPAMGAEFKSTYRYGTQPVITDSWPAAARSVDGLLHLTLSQTPAKGSIKVEIEVTADVYQDLTAYSEEFTPKQTYPTAVIGKA